MQPQQLQRAKSLRRKQTEPEQKLWYYLRGHRFEGIKFKRQKPIGRYIVDFICVKKNLIIELDGSQHMEQTNYDRVRDEWLHQQGYKVIRIWNNDVMNRIEQVLEFIWQELSSFSNPLPLPLSRNWLQRLKLVHYAGEGS